MKELAGTIVRPGRSCCLTSACTIHYKNTTHRE